ncbi:MAG: PfkB family carbohydrate kinase [Patescibacteria group bacterium]
MKDLLSILACFSSKRVAVLGDIMLDHYLEGRATRMSPEADIPIISVEKEWFALGGAGNTAANIASLGAEVILFGQVGVDNFGKQIKENMPSGVNGKGIFFNDSRPTIRKIRILVDGKHIVRADKDGDCSYIEEKLESDATWYFDSAIPVFAPDAIIVSDYKKGFVTEKLAREVMAIIQREQKMLIVDTKPKHFLWFRGCHCIKPNKVEAEGFTGVKIEDLESAEKAGNIIKKRLETNVLLTLGHMGMMLFEEERTTHFSSNAKDVFDVTGAGDTVLAVFGLALASGASLRQAADLANHAAAIAIAKVGTSRLSLEELKNSIS